MGNAKNVCYPSATQQQHARKTNLFVTDNFYVKMLTSQGFFFFFFFSNLILANLPDSAEGREIKLPKVKWCYYNCNVAAGGEAEEDLPWS